MSDTRIIRSLGYKIERELGVGTTSAVYLVKSKGKKYALKLPLHNSKQRLPFEVCVRKLHNHLSASLNLFDVEGVAQFVKADYFKDHSKASLAVVMQYIPGDTVEKAGYISEYQLSQLEKTVSDVHKRGVFCLDINPGNVIISNVGPKLIDFSQARCYGSVSKTGVQRFEDMLKEYKARDLEKLRALVK